MASKLDPESLSVETFEVSREPDITGPITPMKTDEPWYHSCCYVCWISKRTDCGPCSFIVVTVAEPEPDIA